MKSKLFVIVILVVFVGTFAGYRYWNGALAPISDEAPLEDFVIQSGESLESVTKRLEDNNVIRDALVFQIYLRLNGLDREIQAGEYQVQPSLSVPEIAQALTRGTFQVRVTVQEGFRVEQVGNLVADALAEKASEDFNRDQWYQSFVDLAEEKEGYLFPDTYFLPQDAESGRVVDLMEENFDRRVTDELRADARESGMTLDEMVTMASIIEREARHPEDLPIVAGILLRRWREGTLIGADATVQYVLGYSESEETWWKKVITADDLEINSSYNTRKFPGLPPTPIANPGLAAMRAVVYPEETDYYYYLSDAEGRMHYAETLAEHEENSARYI